MTILAPEIDLVAERIARKNGLVPAEAIDRCRAIQDRMRSVGSARPLAEVLCDQGYISDRQAVRLVEAVERTLDRVREAGGIPRELRAEARRDPRTDRSGTTSGSAPREEATVLFRRGGGDVSTLVSRLDRREPRVVEPEELASVDGVGSTFGPYEVRGELGSGGMARVYRAHDPAADREVALKIMRADLATDPDHVRRFCREAAHALRVDHASVARVHEVGIVGGRHYYTMELVEGETLQAAAERGLSTEETFVVLRQIAEGLAALHRRGVAHRDLKPNNVVLTTMSTRYGCAIEGESEIIAKIIDFGLARGCGESDPEDGRRIFGTAKYMAPELARTEETWDGRVDVFSLGVMAYQLLAGRPPFDSSSSVDLLSANMYRDPEPFDEEALGLPVGSWNLVRRMMARDPDDRPPARDLMHSIDAVLAGRGRRATSHETAPSATGRTDVLGWVRGRVGAGVGRAAAVAAGLLLALLLASSVGGSDGSTSPATASARGAATLELEGFNEGGPSGSEATRDPAAYREHRDRADRFRAQGRHDRAIRAYEAARRASPSEGATAEVEDRIREVREERAVARAEAHLAAGRRSAALGALRGVPDPSARVTDRIAAVEAAQRSEDLLAEAERYETRGALDTARALYRRAARAAERAGDEAPLPADRLASRAAELERAVARADRETEARSRVDEAIRATSRGEVRRALRALSRAARLLPEDRRVRRALALLEARRGTPRDEAFVPGSAGSPAFRTDRRPVTNRDWAGFLRENPSVGIPSGWSGRRPPLGTEDEPVRGIPVADARAYADWAGKVLPGPRALERAEAVCEERVDADELLAADLRAALGRTRLEVSGRSEASLAGGRDDDEVLREGFRCARPIPSSEGRTP